MPISKINFHNNIYDMIVIGGGPGGYTAALYAARAGLDTVITEKLYAGGQMVLTDKIDNYPGFENGIDGFSLGEKMRKGAERFGVKSVFSEVRSVDFTGQIKSVETADGNILGKTVVIATGAAPRKLGVIGEEEYKGKGVSYCATCDGMFYRDKSVIVVGGGNTAAEDTLILSRICKEVILIHRRDTLKASKIYRDSLDKAKNVRFIWDSTVVEMLGNEKLTDARIRNLKTKAEQTIPCDGIFICIGRTPTTDFLKGQLDLDSAGYIVSDESTRTNIPGVLAVGDVRTKSVRQIVTAVADGAVAAYCAEEYLSEIFNN